MIFGYIALAIYLVLAAVLLCSLEIISREHRFKKDASDHLFILGVASAWPVIAAVASGVHALEWLKRRQMRRNVRENYYDR